jgi:hypothetical protein
VDHLLDSIDSERHLPHYANVLDMQKVCVPPIGKIDQ